MITAGAPFYGTWSHQQRYYTGEHLLNLLHGARQVARIIGTLPGSYALMFLRQDVFARDGPRLGLAAYPIVDAETGADADPYAPASGTRYPSWINFRHLAEAAALLEIIAAPLSEPVHACFYNIRSRLDGSTPTALSWRRIAPGFDPENDPSPVQPTSTAGGGDGTVPGWAAWHAHTPEGNRIELAVARSHADLVEHREVLATKMLSTEPRRRRRRRPRSSTSCATYAPAAPSGTTRAPAILRSGAASIGNSSDEPACETWP